MSETPIFARIALSMSGGGFRAAAYGLSTLNTLYLLGVLDNVHMLSTISGGTFAGAYYALRRKQGADFPTIYHELETLLRADTVFERALARWQQATTGRGQNYKLIRAFADEYHEQLFREALFGVFWEPDKPRSTPFPLQTLIFGSTELYSGLAFRFQYATLPSTQFVTRAGEKRDWYFIGNGNVHIPHVRARELRLADIVAASSCFPVGFEALDLPTDFRTNNPDPMPFRANNNRPLAIGNVAVIDGGVYDNQGIEGLLLANRRNRTYLKRRGASIPDERKERMLPSTLFLVADVASAEFNIYPPDAAPAARKSQSLGRWMSIVQLIFWVSIVGALLGLGLALLDQWSNFWGGLLLGLGLAVGAVAWGIGRVWRWGTGLFRRSVPDVYALAMPPLSKLTINQLIYLLGLRFKTAKSLLLSIFLRRVRSLNYGLLYRDNDVDVDDPLPTPDVIASIIGSLLNDAQKPKYKADLEGFMPIIEKASSMSTTLWWLHEKDKMDSILASAGITLSWRIRQLFSRKRATAREEDTSFKPLPKDTEVLRRANLIFDAYRLANDKNSGLYFPAFRLTPAMKELLDRRDITAAGLLAEAKKE